MSITNFKNVKNASTLNKVFSLVNLPEGISGWSLDLEKDIPFRYVYDLKTNSGFSLKEWKIDEIGIENYKLDYAVSHDMDVSDTDLTSLEYSPVKAYGKVDCSNNQLTSLKWAPKIVGGSFNCSHNKLSSLIGSPEEISGTYSCIRNDKLTSLVGITQNLVNLDAQNCSLTSLDGIGKVSEQISCQYNNLTTLEGCPEGVATLYCEANELKNFIGSPRKIITIRGLKNKFTSFEGFPEDIDYLYCDISYIEDNFAFFPSSVNVGLYISCLHTEKQKAEMFLKRAEEINKLLLSIINITYYA